MNITTKSGFKCKVNDKLAKDWRLIKVLAKCQKEATAFEGCIELEAVLLGAKGADALEAHLEALDGYVDTEKLFAELTEIVDAISTKN